MQSTDKIPSNYGTELENLEKSNSSMTSKLKPLLSEKPSTNQTSVSLPTEPFRGFSLKNQSGGSLSQTYMHYSNNLYQLLDANSESSNNFEQSSSFRSNFLLTSLAATEKIQVSKTLLAQAGNQAPSRYVRFFIESCGEDPGNDPFQSEGFSVELSSAGGLNFSYKPKDSQSTAIEEYRPNQGNQPCAELVDRDRIFADTDDKFLVISFWTQEKNINLGNLRHLKNKYQIFNPAGVPLYEIPDIFVSQGTSHSVFIYDVNRETVGEIAFAFDDLTTMKAITTFTDKVRPKDKLLILGAVFMIIAKIPFSKPNGKANEEECNMGCFVNSVVKRFCPTG